MKSCDDAPPNEGDRLIWVRAGKGSRTLPPMTTVWAVTTTQQGFMVIDENGVLHNVQLTRLFRPDDIQEFLLEVATKEPPHQRARPGDLVISKEQQKGLPAKLMTELLARLSPPQT